jgi:hypothetical protein
MSHPKGPVIAFGVGAYGCGRSVTTSYATRCTSPAAKCSHARNMCSEFMAKRFSSAKNSERYYLTKNPEQLG